MAFIVRSIYFLVMIIFLSRISCLCGTFTIDLQWYQISTPMETHNAHTNSTNILDPAYNEFGYNEHWAVTSRFRCSKIIGKNVKRFVRERVFVFTTNSFFCIFFARCKRSSVYLTVPPFPSRYTGSHLQRAT